MTRVNVGIEPHELCDQHLIAEYRELPRCFASFKQRPPEQFTLGRGHVTWCAQYPGMLADRHRALVAEMRRRGFRVSYPEPPVADGARPEQKEVARARRIVLERIRERLGSMKEPRWS